MVSAGHRIDTPFIFETGFWRFVLSTGRFEELICVFPNGQRV